MIGECGMCYLDNKELFHFALYVEGSEGINICLECRIKVTNFIRAEKANNFTEKLNKRFEQLKSSRS